MGHKKPQDSGKSFETFEFQHVGTKKYEVLEQRFAGKRDNFEIQNRPKGILKF